jgi:hypothetical protein
MLQIPARGGVGRTGGIIALLFLLTSSIIYRWLKGTSTK